MLTKDKVVAILPGVAHLDDYFYPLVYGMEMFDIDTPPRMGAYLAQIGEESNRFRALKEYASGKEYEGRADLGNTAVGDGERYKGRGPIQITGRTNYRRCGEGLNLDLLAQPELLEEPANAFMSSGWYWKDKGLNGWGDQPESYVHPGVHHYDKFQWITVLINGGLNGYADRLANYNRARIVLGF